MTSPQSELTTHHGGGGARPSALVIIAGATAVSLLLGALTSPAQTVLPDAIRPFANSSSGWTLLTVLVVWATREDRAWVAAVMGGCSFVALVAGYVAASTLRGFPDSERFFFLVAVIVGPIVGLCASWLRRRDLLAGLGTAALAGIGLGEGVYGLLVISGSTGWFYWSLISAVAVTLIVAMARRITRTRWKVLAALGPLIVATAFYIVYTSAGSIMLSLEALLGSQS